MNDGLRRHRILRKIEPALQPCSFRQVSVLERITNLLNLRKRSMLSASQGTRLPTRGLISSRFVFPRHFPSDVLPQTFFPRNSSPDILPQKFFPKGSSPKVLPQALCPRAVFLKAVRMRPSSCSKELYFRSDVVQWSGMCANTSCSYTKHPMY